MKDKECPEQLTVATLIEKLRRYRGTAKVCIEGCDCSGDAVDVEGWGPRSRLPDVDCTEVLIIREYDEQGYPV